MEKPTILPHGSDRDFHHGDSSRDRGRDERLTQLVVLLAVRVRVAVVGPPLDTNARGANNQHHVDNRLGADKTNKSTQKTSATQPIA
jgi:hypothetical protein